MAELWWQAESMADTIQHALNHVNEARRRAREARPGWELDACEDHFKALDHLSTALFQLNSVDELPLAQRQGVAAPQRFDKLLKAIPSDGQALLLARPSVQQFATFKPTILYHGAPGMSQQRLEDIPGDVRMNASAAYDELNRGWTRWQDTRARGSEVLRRLSRSILVVRNNIAHGEKTISGPDKERTKRNRDVAATVLAVLEDVLDFIFDRPSCRLCAYGTLRPGQPNNEILAGNGNWRPVKLIDGVIEEESGLPVFTYVKGATAQAELFESSDLPVLWQQLDQFEGSPYIRVLGLYRHDGRIGVGNVYLNAAEAF